MKKGFTLAELLGVIVIIGLLLVLIVPTILNRLDSTSEDTNKAENHLIYDAADQYIREHPQDYPSGKAGRYCIAIQSLIDDGKLVSPVTDVTTGKDISDKSVMVTIYSNGNTDYEIKEGADCQELKSLPMIDFIIEPNGSSWVKQRKVTIIYPSTSEDFEASHRIDGGGWTRDSAADNGGNVEIVFTKIGQLEARLKSDKIISSKVNLINIDSEIPVITKVAMGTWGTEKNNFQITAKDDISGISGIYVSTSNVKPSENASGWTSVSSKPGEVKTFTKALDPGTYYIWVKDKAGNICSASATGKVVETICPGNICYVSSSGSDSGYGSKRSPFASLQKAFDMVPNNGKVVLLSNIKLTNQAQDLDQAKTVTLTSDGNNRYIIYRHDTYEYSMIYQSNSSSKLTISNLIIDGNNRDTKYAMVTLTGETLIENCVLRNARNLSNYGGGINRRETSNVTLRNVEFYNNYATAGGAAIWGHGIMHMYDISIHDNHSWDGNVWNYGYLYFHSGRIYNNTAHYDAGVRNYNQFYMYGGEIDHNVSEDQVQSGGLKNGCYHWGDGKYYQGVSYLQGGSIHDNSPRDTYTNYTWCDETE